MFYRSLVFTGLLLFLHKIFSAQQKQMIKQIEIALPPMSRGFHNIDQFIIDAINPLPEKGLLNIFIKHTSAGLLINENADPAVHVDLNTLLDRVAPENDPQYTHTLEGPDDMPAHFKSLILGHSLSVPITNGSINFGTWQSIYLGEFRNRGGSRKLVLTLYS
jgi:secondary thiamine-phosphate synthase enzyme